MSTNLVSDATVQVRASTNKSNETVAVAMRNLVEDSLERGVNRILCVLPTGAGKTLTSGLIFSSPRVRKALGIEGDRPLRLLNELNVRAVSVGLFSL